MYEPGGKAIHEELRAIAAAIRSGESDWLYKTLAGHVVDVGTTGSANIAGTVPVRTFANAASNQLIFTALLDQSWVEGGLVTPQVLWAPGDTNAGNVNWGLEYAVLAPNGTPTTATATASTATPGVAYQQTKSELTSIDLSGFAVGSTFIGRLYRDGVADSYNGTVLLLNLGLLVFVNGTGSVYPEAKA